MINALEAVASLVKPVAMQVLLAYERLESGVAYNPLSDEVARDPYAVYRRLRDKGSDPPHEAGRCLGPDPLRGRRRRAARSRSASPPRIAASTMSG